MRLIGRIWGWTDRQNGFRRVVLVIAPGFALLCGVMLGAVGFRQWAHVHGRPVEHAQVVGAERTGRTERCGKGAEADVYRLVWISANPPAGLPARFTNEEGCDRSEIGDTHDVVRVVSDSGSVHVWDDPATSLAQAAALFAAGLGGGYGIGFLAGTVRWGWGRFRNRSARHVRTTSS